MDVDHYFSTNRTKKHMAKKCSGVTKTVTTAGRKFVLDMDIIIVIRKDK